MLDYDADTSVYWIKENTGFDYWLDEHCEFKGVGLFVVEGIKGEYITGRGWISGDVCEDDDEEWEFAQIRPATAAEIRDGLLSAAPVIPEN